MPVSNELLEVAFVGDASTKTFAVPYYFLAREDLRVYVAGVLQTLDTHYTVTGAGVPAGGSVVFGLAPAAGAVVTVRRAPPVTQLVNVENNITMLQQFFNNSMDKLTMLIQSVRRDAVRAPDNDLGGSLILPTAVNRASRLLGFDNTGAVIPLPMEMPNATGPFSQRSLYDLAAKNFVFLQTDDPQQRLIYYVKLSAANGDWSQALIASQGAAASIASAWTPEAYGASGSLQTALGSTVSGNQSVALSSAIDFAVGQGIRINRAGATFALNLPTGLAIAPQGAAGATTRKYAIRAIDDHGGLGVAVRATLANANAVLDFTNYCRITWAAPGAGPAPNGYAVYGRTNVADGSLTLIGVTSNLFFNDYGVNQAVEADWSVTNDAGGPFNGYHVASITGLAGTTATVNPAPAQTVANQTAAHDDTAALQALLVAAPSPQLVYLAKAYPISSKIQFSKRGVFRGAGAADGDVTTRGAGFVWRGAPVPTAVQWGDITGSAVLQGGALSDLEFDGAGVADRALTVKDASTSVFERIKVRKGTRSGLYITCSAAGALNVATRFVDLFAPMLDGSMVDAHGVEIDGLNNLLTQASFIRPRLSHAAGHGFYWPPGVGHGACDGSLFDHPFTFRGATHTGYAIYIGTDDPNMITGDFAFDGLSVLNGGIYVANPGRIEYSVFNNFDTRNVGSIRFAAMPFEGPGVGDLGANSPNGTYFGWKRHPGGLSSAFKNDDFDFVDYAGGVLRTAEGNWLVAEAPAGGSVVSSIVGVDGIDINTAAVLNQRLTIFGQAKNRNAHYPASLWSVYFPAGTDTKARVGFLLDSTSDPASRVCWRYDAASGFWVCECASGGVVTTVATTLTIANSIMRFRVEYDDTQALFYYAFGNAGGLKLSTADNWYLGARITTNIPTVPLRLAAQIEALAAASKRITLQHVSASRYMGGW